MNFRILVYFKKLTKPFKGGWPCIYGFGYYFRVHWGCMKQRSVWWRFCALQKWQKRFVCSTKNFYYECRRSVYLATSKTLAVNNVPIWTTLMACSPYADHWGNIHHILHIWRNQGRRTPKLDWFTNGIFTRSYTTQKNMYYNHTNVYKFFATLRSWYLG